jgi:hypothetical protein
MKQTYVIVGIHNEDGYKRLELKPLESFVDKKKEIKPSLLNISSMVRDVGNMYQQNMRVDIIRIPVDAFKDMKLVIDGEFTISYGRGEFIYG